MTEPINRNISMATRKEYDVASGGGYQATVISGKGIAGFVSWPLV
jgi:hypothetical protein